MRFHAARVANAGPLAKGFLRGSKDIFEHFGGQPAGVRVVARAMIAVDEVAAIGQRVDRAMREAIIGEPPAEAAAA